MKLLNFDDPFFRNIHAAQEGDLPFPEGPVPPMGDLPLSVRATPTAPRGSGLSERDFEARMGIADPGRDAAYADRAPERRRARAAAIADDQGQFEMDFDGLAELDPEALSGDDLVVVQDALSDLDRLEGEIAGVSESADRLIAR